MNIKYTQITSRDLNHAGELELKIYKPNGTFQYVVVPLFPAPAEVAIKTMVYIMEIYRKRNKFSDTMYISVYSTDGPEPRMVGMCGIEGDDLAVINRPHREAEQAPPPPKKGWWRKFIEWASRDSIPFCP